MTWKARDITAVVCAFRCVHQLAEFRNGAFDFIGENHFAFRLAETGQDPVFVTNFCGWITSLINSLCVSGTDLNVALERVCSGCLNLSLLLWWFVLWCWFLNWFPNRSGGNTFMGAVDGLLGRFTDTPEPQVILGVQLPGCWGIVMQCFWCSWTTSHHPKKHKISKSAYHRKFQASGGFSWEPDLFKISIYDAFKDITYFLNQSIVWVWIAIPHSEPVEWFGFFCSANDGIAFLGQVKCWFTGCQKANHRSIHRPNPSQIQMFFGYK